MSIRHYNALAWEDRLKSVFDGIDHELEARFGMKYPLHPARPRQGSTSNPEESGLFDVGAAFTAGYGSPSGRGYMVDINLATLSRVPPEIVEEIEVYVERRLREELPVAFPGQSLQVVREGARFKIVGDLRLGSVTG